MKSFNLNTVFSFILLLFVVSTFILNLGCLWNYMTSDMYGDMWVSKLMWEQKTILPSDWGFGNQIYLAAPPNMCAILFGISGNLLISMGLTSCIFTILFIIAFHWCFKTILDKAEITVSLVLLFTSLISINALDDMFCQLFFVGCTYYTCYAISFLVSLGVYIRLYKGAPLSQHPLACGLSLILALLMGVQSLRQTMIMVIPFIMFEVILFVYIRWKKSAYSLATCIFVGLTTVFNITGVVISKLIPVQRDTIYGGLKISPFEDLSGKAISTISNIKSLLGYSQPYRDFSDGRFGMIDVLLLFVAAAFTILLIVSLWQYFRKIKSNESALNVSIIFCMLSVLCVFGTFWVLDIDRLSKYAFIFFLLMPLLYVFTVRNLSIRGAKIAKGLLLVSSVIILSVTFVGPIVKTYTQTSVYKEIADYMLDNNRYVLYADWDDAGNVAGASKLAITAGRWDAQDVFRVKPHTNVMTIYSDDDNNKALYLFTDFNFLAAKEYLSKHKVSFKLLKTFTSSTGDKKYIVQIDRQVMHN